MLLLLKKIRKEVGIVGILRIPFILVSLLWHNLLLNLYQYDRDKLKRDIQKLKTLTIRDFNFTPFYEDDDYKNERVNTFHNARENFDFWVRVEFASIVSAFKTNLEDDDKVYDIIPNGNVPSFYRYHYLNKGKNDQWEWYLTPWHRSIHWFSYLLWDKRFTEYLLPIYEHYKKWYKEDLIWFTKLGTASNIFAVEGGKAFHCLNQYLIDGDENMLNKYIKHIHRIQYNIETQFRNGVPTEGGIYGRFMIMGIIHLDWIHRKLGLEYRFFNDRFLNEYADYLETVFTPDGGFETSGDSHFEIDGLVEGRVFHYFSQISNRPIYRKIVEHYKLDKDTTLYLKLEN
jgi:hypothetical protein